MAIYGRLFAPIYPALATRQLQLKCEIKLREVQCQCSHSVIRFCAEDSGVISYFEQGWAGSVRSLEAMATGMQIAQILFAKGKGRVELRNAMRNERLVKWAVRTRASLGRFQAGMILLYAQ